MTWKGEKIRVFFFGDYDFLLKVFGISGAQSLHPYLWCTASKTHILKAPDEQPEIPGRTLLKIKRDYIKFQRHGYDKKYARVCNNVCNKPLFNVEPSQVPPPYLHIMFGIVKKHHVLLEQDCHALDQDIGKSLAKENGILRPSLILENMSIT